MFKCTFYAFQKKRNSTKRPSANFRFQDEFEMTTNDSLDVLHPVLRFQRNVIQIPSYYENGTYREYNYCYISALHRYYFIENWECKNGIWYCYLSVDALATYKYAIGSTSQYVVRSSEKFNTQLLDYRYPARTEVAVQHVSTTFSWSSDFTYVLGLLGNGGIRYYIATREEITNFINYILGDLYAEDAVGKLGLTAYPEMKATLNPLQYIASLTAFPFNIPRGQAVSSVRVGYTTVGVNFYHLQFYTNSDSFTVNVPNHPLYESTGENKRDYLQVAPFTTLTLSAPPFGLIPIERYNSNVKNIRCIIKTDLRTGSATLEVSEFAPQQAVLARVSSQVGIPFQISQVIASGYGAASAVRDISSVIGSAISGNVLGAIGSAANGVGNYLSSQIPKSTSTGSIGSFDQVVGRSFSLSAEFKLPVEEDIANLGRPLCSVQRVGSLGGYMEIDRPHLDFSGMNEEREAIKSFMRDGFYYE